MTVPIKNQYVDAPAAPDRNEAIRKSLRVGQIISFALIQGVILMAAVATFIAKSDFANDEAARQAAPSSPLDSVLTLVGFGIAMAALPAAWVALKYLRDAAASRSPAAASPSQPTAAAEEDNRLTPKQEHLLGANQTAVILAQAILEGGAMANAFIMLFTGNLWHLAAIAVLLAGIAFLTPTQARIENLLDQV